MSGTRSNLQNMSVRKKATVEQQMTDYHCLQQLPCAGHSWELSSSFLSSAPCPSRKNSHATVSGSTGFSTGKVDDPTVTKYTCCYDDTSRLRMYEIKWSDYSARGTKITKDYEYGQILLQDINHTANICDYNADNYNTYTDTDGHCIITVCHYSGSTQYTSAWEMNSISLCVHAHSQGHCGLHAAHTGCSDIHIPSISITQLLIKIIRKLAFKGITLMLCDNWDTLASIVIQNTTIPVSPSSGCIAVSRYLEKYRKYREMTKPYSSYHSTVDNDYTLHVVQK